MSDSPSNRREFLQASLAAGAALSVAATGGAEDAASKGLPTRPLGKTGVQVSIICLGGWHIGSVKDETEAIKIMHTAIDEGLTFFDNAWDYHDGGSEEIMGKALAMDGKRKKFFLMTKNCGRDAKTASSTSRTACAACRPTSSTSGSSTRSTTTTIPTGSSSTAAWPRCSRPRRTARSASSASPATRTRTST